MGKLSFWRRDGTTPSNRLAQWAKHFEDNGVTYEQVAQMQETQGITSYWPVLAARMLDDGISQTR